MGNANVYDRKKLRYKYYKLEEREKINLSYNNIQALDYHIFNDLVNAKSINLSHNELEILGSIFHGLYNLNEIDLQYNQLKEIDSRCFRNLTKLECIKLQDNRLKSLYSDLFQGLTNLKRVYLNNNQIHELCSNLFKDCSNLITVRLEDNQLNSIDPYVFDSLKNLKFVTLFNNNWTTNYLELSLEENVKSSIEIFFKNSKTNDIEYIVDPNIGLFNEKYKKITQIGSGISCSVHMVKNIFDNKKYALKCLHNLHMYSNESIILEHLQSQHVIKFIESFDHKELKCIVTEFCEGGDLRRRIEKCKNEEVSLNEDNIDLWSKEIIDAIHFIHSKKVIHRDIKPDNIFITMCNHLKVGDFGVSILYDNSDTDPLTFLGTKYYMSPEIKDRISYGYKTDVWSSGCVILEMITLKKLQESVQNDIDQILEKLKIGSFLKRLLQKMLVVDQTKRSDSKNLFLWIKNHYDNE